MNQRNCKKTITDLVVNDYFTPNIKAEVILDTLLTPFVADILNKCLQNKFPDENVKLIAKEMSVCEETDTDKTVTLRGPKIDYVLEGENFVYLVELKTSNSSIDIEQLNRYNTHCSGKDFREALGDKLIKILNKYCENLKIESLNPNCFSFLDTYVGSNYTEKAIGYLKKHKKSSTFKYLYTAAQILDNCDNIDTLMKKKLCLIYITPDGTQPKNIGVLAKDFYIHPEGANSISLKEAANYLENSNELAQMLADIIKKIYG